MMNPFHGWVLGALLSSAATAASAGTAELLVTDFQENVRNSANTGGARVVGVQLVGQRDDVELRALIPQSWQDRPFCVRTVSSDGLYDSVNPYRVSAAAGILVEVPHLALSKHAGQLMQYTPDAYAITVTDGACEGSTGSLQAALAVWRTEAPVGQSFALLVNSFDADRMVALPSQGGTDGAQVECETISADVSVAYDRRCEIPFSAGAGPVQVELLPVKGGRLGRSEFITIVLPDA